MDNETTKTGGSERAVEPAKGGRPSKLTRAVQDRIVTPSTWDPLVSARPF